MHNQERSASCEFEEVAVHDLLDGIHTLKCHRSGTGTIVSAPGDGPDIILSWALRSVTVEARSIDQESVKMASANAVISARRALACMVDWYISRDMANLCEKRGRDKSFQKTDFLKRRGIIDDLTSRVLARAIDERNRVEHEYIAPELATAEDVVELIRRTMSAIRQCSDPGLGPWLYGGLNYGYSIGPNGERVSFEGWDEPLLVFMRSAARPWIGIILPDSDTTATVRRIWMDQINMEELANILSITESKFGVSGSYWPQSGCDLMASRLGLI